MPLTSPLTAHCVWSALGIGSTCTQRMSTTALKAWCLDVPPEEQPLIGALNLTAGTKVGIYGDSHPEMPEDWVDLQVCHGHQQLPGWSLPTPSCVCVCVCACQVRYPNVDPANLRRVWDETTQTCRNVLSGMSLRVLFTEVCRSELSLRRTRSLPNAHARG